MLVRGTVALPEQVAGEARRHELHGGEVLRVPQLHPEPVAGSQPGLDVDQADAGHRDRTAGCSTVGQQPERQTSRTGSLPFFRYGLVRVEDLRRDVEREDLGTWTTSGSSDGWSPVALWLRQWSRAGGRGVRPRAGGVGGEPDTQVRVAQENRRGRLLS